LSSCQVGEPTGQDVTSKSSSGVEEPTPAQPPHRTLDPNDPLFSLEVSDAGEFHNDILRAFDQRRSFASTAPIDEATYQATMVSAVNQVLAARGIPGEVSSDDIRYLAQQGYYVARACGLDPANMREDAPVELVDFLCSSRRISDPEKKALLVGIADARNGVRNPHVRMPTDGSAESPAFVRYQEVAIASRTLWTDLVPVQMPGPGDGRIVDRNYGDAIFRWGFEYFVDAAYAALLPGLAGYILGAYFSGMVHLTFYVMDHPEDGSGGGPGDNSCPCCLCTGP